MNHKGVIAHILDKSGMCARDKIFSEICKSFFCLRRLRLASVASWLFYVTLKGTNVDFKHKKSPSQGFSLRISGGGSQLLFLAFSGLFFQVKLFSCLAISVFSFCFKLCLLFFFDVSVNFFQASF